MTSRRRETVSVAEAKARLAQCVHHAEEGRSVVITRHGKPVAALVRAEDLDRLERLRSAGPEGGLASIAGGWKDSEALADEISTAVRSQPRDVHPLE